MQKMMFVRKPGEKLHHHRLKCSENHITLRQARANLGKNGSMTTTVTVQTALVFDRPGFQLLRLKARGFQHYRFNQNKPSGAQHTYVLNESLKADCSCKAKYFWKNSYRSWQTASLCFFWHILRQNWSIIRGTLSL